MAVVDMLDRILDSLSEALMHKISVLPSPAANSMYIRMCIYMCLSYSPNKGGTTKPRYPGDEQSWNMSYWQLGLGT